MVINELVTESINQGALRAHVKIHTVDSEIKFTYEVNIPSTWLEKAPITCDVLNTATQNNWTVTNSASGCIVTGLIHKPKALNSN